MKRDLSIYVSKEDFREAAQVQHKLKKYEKMRDALDAMYETRRYEQMIVMA